jgi:phosphatidate cytidylyltransferase
MTDLAALFVLVALTLGAASLAAHLIRNRLGPTAFVENLTQRIDAWWVMCIVLGVAFALGPGATILLFAFLSFAVLREFLTLTRRSRADHYALIFAFFVALPVQYLAIWRDWYGFFTVFIPVWTFMILPTLSVLRGQTEGFLTRMAETQWALMVSVFCVSHVPALLFLDIPGFDKSGVLLVAFLVIVVQGSDVLQYIWGKMLGRTKVAPRTSPSKTWEGLVGGTLSAALLGAALFWLTPFPPLTAGFLAFVCAIVGFFGGLVLSAVKRDRGVKDWGTTIEGHGGFLDRLDGVVFAAPIFFHLLRFFWVTNPATMNTVF